MITKSVSSVTQSFLILCDPMNCSTPGLPVHHQLPEFTQTQVHELVMPSNSLILCCPLLLLPSVFPHIRVFSDESVLCIRWPKVLEFQLQRQSFQWIFIDCLDLLEVWGTLGSLLQHHSSKESFLRQSAFFVTQFSHLYATTGKKQLLLDGPFSAK